MDAQVLSQLEPDLATGVRWGRELKGIEIRSFATLFMLDAGRPVRVKELVEALHDRGFAVAGRRSKVISDGLRWEVARGRVQRLGRGLYRATGRIPRTTLRRMRKRVERVAAQPLRPVRMQPLRREPRPLVSDDGPWRYRLRYGIMKAPRTPWGYGILRALPRGEPKTTLERGLRAQRERRIDRQLDEPFGPYMV